MGASILNGKELAKKIKVQLRLEVEKLKEKSINPGLAVIIVGDDPASRVYVNSKRKACGEIGVESFEYALDKDVPEDELIELIHTLNGDKRINGILVQLPLPKHINEEKVILAIDVLKDVDAFHPTNVGRLMIGNPVFLPCTPSGIMRLIAESGVDVSGKECVIVGRSNIVGKPMSMLLLSQNGTVTICHSKTKNIEEVCKRADILIVAVGRAEMVKGDWLKPGAVVIDVGINRLENKKLVGDVEFGTARGAAAAITPVPGGVGPMTIAMLMENTVKAAKLQSNI
ncbi:MAG: bifunctional methylenetetrahydrofolate dehydrogenase/methenyltetrahydrofolate cyclohydrolase FolD [Clostridium sp.]|nr:bifunctional methylenetetrahydrofolate dehydrogenase/methenyltetrahydrofolate cyclohydrolase FolD [Clostridium sp.]